MAYYLDYNGSKKLVKLYNIDNCITDILSISFLAVTFRRKYRTSSYFWCGAVCLHLENILFYLIKIWHEWSLIIVSNILQLLHCKNIGQSFKPHACDSYTFIKAVVFFFMSMYKINYFQVGKCQNIFNTIVINEYYVLR